MSKKQSDFGAIGNIYGSMLNDVQVVKESKEECIGDSPLLDGGPENSGYEDIKIDRKLNKDLDNAYNIDKLSYDEDEEGDNLSTLSDSELIEIAHQEGIEELIVPDGEGGLANRDEIINYINDVSKNDIIHGNILEAYSAVTESSENVPGATRADRNFNPYRNLTSRPRTSGSAKSNFKRNELEAEHQVGQRKRLAAGAAMNNSLKDYLASHEVTDEDREFYTSNAPSAAPDASDQTIKIFNFYNKPGVKEGSSEDEENDTETEILARESINNFMSKRKSQFDKLYENVMFGDEGAAPESDELDALGLDDEVADGEAEEVTLTLDREVAQTLLDIIQAAIGGEDDLEGGEDLEGDEGGFEGDFEEDEESAAAGTKNLSTGYNDGKSNKVGTVNPVGGSATSQVQDKVGNDGDHGHALNGAKAPNVGTKNKVGKLNTNKDMFSQ